MRQIFSQGYDHYEQCNAGVVFLQNTFWSFGFFSFVKSKAFQGIKPKTPRTIHRSGNDYQMFRGKSSMSCSEVDNKGYSAFE